MSFEFDLHPFPSRKDKFKPFKFGFSRFDLTLKPQEEVEFVVEEEAAFEEMITTYAKIRNFMLNPASVLRSSPSVKEKVSEEITESF